MVCRALVAIMLIMSATGCYKSTCADPICWENPPDGDSDGGVVFTDGSLPDAGRDAAPDFEEVDAAVTIPYPGCPDRPPLIPPNRFFWSGNTPGEPKLTTIGMAGTCQRIVAALSNFEIMVTPMPGRVDTVNLITTGSSTSIMGGAYPEYRGRAIASAPYGFAVFADETASNRYTLKTYDNDGHPLADTVLIGGIGNVMTIAETLGDPLFIQMSTLHAGTNSLFMQEITHTTTPNFDSAQRVPFSMPSEFILGEVVRGDSWAALKVGYLEGSTAVGEIVFVSSVGERHIRFAEQRFFANQDGNLVLKKLIQQQSDIAPHRDGVLVATNRSTGGVAYLLQPDGTERFTVLMNGTGTAVTQLPYGFAAASYQGGQIHVTIRNTIEGTSQTVTISAPHEILDSPRLSSAFYGYLIGVSTTFFDLPNNVSKTRLDTIASAPP